MIKTFKSQAARELYQRGQTAQPGAPPQELWGRTLILLRYLGNVEDIRDVNAAPDLDLTPMGRKTGDYSIRIGGSGKVEWRLSFTWRNRECQGVDIYST